MALEGNDESQDPLERLIRAAESGQLAEEVPHVIPGSLQWLFEHWPDQVVPRLRETFQTFLTRRTAPPLAEERGYVGHQELWNVLGMAAVFNGRPTLALELYRHLLQVLREAQQRIGRLHKGTPYHQIGWTHLMSGEPPDHARDWFLLAALEDSITYGSNDGAFPETPASRVLRAQYDLTDVALRRLLDAVAAVRQFQNELVRKVVIENPELILLEMRALVRTVGSEP
jgi:hypothetical protein